MNDFEDPSPVETDNETGPGPWVTAGFDDECSRGFCSGISEGEDIRADGFGGWECRGCVETDQEDMEGYRPNIPHWEGASIRRHEESWFKE